MTILIEHAKHFELTYKTTDLSLSNFRTYSQSGSSNKHMGEIKNRLMYVTVSVPRSPRREKRIMTFLCSLREIEISRRSLTRRGIGHVVEDPSGVYKYGDSCDFLGSWIIEQREYDEGNEDLAEKMKKAIAFWSPMLDLPY